LLTAVPFSAGGVLADAQPLPHGRSRAGDRHLNFYKIRDNLRRNPDALNPDPWTWHVERVTAGSACAGDHDSLCVPLG
jgi:hypothetical protein